MSPATTLFVTLIVLHVVEGLLWVRRSASAFERGLSKRHRALAATAPYGNTHHTFLLLSPLPPFTEIAVVESWPFILGKDRLRLIQVERGPRDKAVTSGSVTREPAAAAGAHADAKDIVAGDPLWATSSPVTARLWAATIAAWAEAATPGDRAETAARALAARFDREALRARIDEVERTARFLRWLSQLTPWVLLGGVYGVFFVPAVADRWHLVAGALGVLLLATWVEMFRVHRRLQPGLRADRALKLVMLMLSIPAAARARAWIARDALAAFHPLAVAEALLDREAFASWAAPRWRDLRFPLGPDPDDARAELEEARRQLLEVYRRFFRAVDVDPYTFEAPPVGAVAYCPRCHGEVMRAQGDCPDCPGVRIIEPADYRRENAPSVPSTART